VVILLAMAYDVDLADRIREALAAEPDVVEKRMFGGLAFLLSGHLTVAANSHGSLMLRVDPTESAALIATAPTVQPMVMQGRELRGWLRVELDLEAPDEELHDWVRRGVDHVRSLPPK
jgi:hypothetical protein